MIPSQRHLFDIPDDVAYFNCAYMSPLLKSALEAGARANAEKARPWSVAPSDFFGCAETCRSTFAQIINAKADDIAIVPSVSYGLATAARNLPVASGSSILVLAEQFPSNVYTWRTLAAQKSARIDTVEWPTAKDGASWTTAIIERINPDTAIVALPHCHWVDGSLIDVARIGAATRAHGAALVMDITQSGGALPIDVAAVRPDFLVCACYKWLLGPYALGFLYVDPKWHDGEPLEQNWIARRGSEDFTRLIDYRDEYQGGARRFDMGERSSFHLLPMALAAMHQLLDWGVGNIQVSLEAITSRLVERTSPLGFASDPEIQRAGHYLGLRARAGLPSDITQRLERQGIFVSVRGDSLRVTPHLYNSDADLEKLIAALADI